MLLLFCNKSFDFFLFSSLSSLVCIFLYQTNIPVEKIHCVSLGLCMNDTYTIDWPWRQRRARIWTPNPTMFSVRSRKAVCKISVHLDEANVPRNCLFLIQRKFSTCSDSDEIFYSHFLGYKSEHFVATTASLIHNPICATPQQFILFWIQGSRILFIIYESLFWILANFSWKYIHMVLHSKKICLQSKCSQTIEWSWFLLGTLKFNHLYDTQGSKTIPTNINYYYFVFQTVFISKLNAECMKNFF